MNQCVPGWDLDDPNPRPSHPIHPHRHQPQSLPAVPVVPMSDFEVAELTWENGNISSHGLGAPRIIKSIAKYPTIATTRPAAAATGAPATAAAWDKHRIPGGGTLEEVVNEATRTHILPPVPFPSFAVAWDAAPLAAATAVDALVPCARDDAEMAVVGKRARVVGEDGRVCASQGSAAPGRGESTLVTLDNCAGAGGCGGAGEDIGFTTTTNNSTSFSPLDGEGGGSPETENTSIGGGANDSICYSRRSQRDAVCEEEENVAPKGGAGRASISTKRSRAAAIHNESERKRRDRINQKMKTLQKLVPNSSKNDKASMLDEVIDYLKQLQAQVNMMSRMSSMMMPMAAMPQLQMSMMANMAQMAQMAQISMGMGMGMMSPNTLAQPGYASLPPPLLHPSAFLPLATASATTSAATSAPWEGNSGDRAQQLGANGGAMPDPFSAFLACQPAQQPMSMEAYNRVAALYQQLYQQNQPQDPKP